MSSRMDYQEFVQKKEKELSNIIIFDKNKFYNGLGQRVLGIEEEDLLEDCLKKFSKEDVIGAVLFKSFGLGLDTGSSIDYIIQFVNGSPIDKFNDDFLNQQLYEKVTKHIDGILSLPFINKKEGLYFFSPNEITNDYKALIKKARKHVFDIFSVNSCDTINKIKKMY